MAKLHWEPLDDCDGGQQARTRRLPMGYWVLGDTRPSGWTLELTQLDERGIEMDPTFMGHYADDSAARHAAQTVEDLPCLLPVALQLVAEG